MTQKQTISRTTIAVLALTALLSFAARPPAEACGYLPDDVAVQLAIKAHFGVPLAAEAGQPALEMEKIRFFKEGAVALVELSDAGVTELLFVTVERLSFIEWKITDVTEATPEARLAFVILDALRRA